MCTIYNYTEASWNFRILVEVIEEEQEEEESEPQIPDHDDNDWDERDQAFYCQFILKPALVFGS